MSETKEQIERRTDEAFARSPWRDPRTDYRALLRLLRDQDAARFETAVAEYEARVVARVEDPAVDPVAAWLDYGRRLAELAGQGHTVRVDVDGRAAPADAELTGPALVLHMPSDESAPAIVVAIPRDPSPAQRATAALLADRRTALPG